MLVLLHELPLEILEHILSFLSAKDLICASQTCRIFQQLGNHPSLWRQLCLSTWNLEWDGKNSARTFLGDSKTEIDEEIDAVSIICDEMNKMETNEKNKNINPWKEYFSQKSVMSSAQALTWKQLDTQTMKGIIPTPRYSHAAVAYQDKIFYFGGQISQAIRYNDLFSYCPGTNSWEQHKVEGLPNISKHSCVQIKGKIFSFGGFDGIARRFELGALDIASMQWSWPATTGSVPSSKSNHAAVAIGNKMYIFGGLQSVNTNLVDSNELHVLNADTMHWETPQVFGEIPQPRCGHRMTVIDGKIYLFGGGQGDNWAKKFNDLYVLDPATYEWTRPKTTGEAADATTFVSLFSLGRFLFIFGGGKHSNRGQVSNHLYMLDTGRYFSENILNIVVSMHWSKLTIGGITPSERDDCTTCILGDSVYFLHGYNSGPIDEFWKIQMSEEVCAIAKVPKMDREDKTLGLDKLKRKLNELFRISKRRIICPTWISALEEKQ